MKRLVRSLRAAALLTAAAVEIRAATVNAQTKSKAPVAQAAAKSPKPAPLLTPAQHSLDEWIVFRFRNAQLLPDSVIASVGTASVAAAAPRVETTRSANRRDTLVALQFDSTLQQPALASGAAVRFADPSGSISEVNAVITARRAFRAPRKPAPRTDHPEDWRVGWAYLVAMPIRTANAAPSAFNGWSVVATPLKPARTTP